MKHVAIWAVALLGGLRLGTADAACYAVYQGADLVYRSVLVPVDLSRTLHETVPSRFGAGASMVIVDSADACLPIDAGRRAAGPISGGMRGASGALAPGRTRSSGAAGYFDAKATPIRSEVGGSP